jgi:hypothetical protein
VADGLWYNRRMTLEELLEMRVGDVLTQDLNGVQLLRDVRNGVTRIILLANGAEAEYLIAVVQALSAPKEASC